MSRARFFIDFNNNNLKSSDSSFETELLSDIRASMKYFFQYRDNRNEFYRSSLDCKNCNGRYVSYNLSCICAR